MNFQDSLGQIANTRQRYLDYVPPQRPAPQLPPLDQPAAPPAPGEQAGGNSGLPPLNGNGAPAQSLFPNYSGELPPILQTSAWQNPQSFFPALLQSISPRFYTELQTQLGGKLPGLPPLAR